MHANFLHILVWSLWNTDRHWWTHNVVCLLSAVNNDSFDWSVQYKQRLFGLCFCVTYRRKWLFSLSFLWFQGTREPCIGWKDFNPAWSSSGLTLNKKSHTYTKKLSKGENLEKLIINSFIVPETWILGNRGPAWTNVGPVRVSSTVLKKISPEHFS